MASGKEYKEYMERNLKDRFDKTMSENPFTHLGDAVYSLLYKSIIRMDIPDDEAYYELKYNPMSDLCDTFWNIIKCEIMGDEA